MKMKMPAFSGYGGGVNTVGWETIRSRVPLREDGGVWVAKRVRVSGLATSNLRHAGPVIFNLTSLSIRRLAPRDSIGWCLNFIVVERLFTGRWPWAGERPAGSILYITQRFAS